MKHGLKVRVALAMLGVAAITFGFSGRKVVLASEDDVDAEAEESIEISKSFSDVHLQKWVSDHADKDKDGMLSPSEIQAVTEIRISDASIEQMWGLENFTSLKKVDLRGCTSFRGIDLPKSVISLDVRGCSSLHEIWAPDGQMKTLLVSGCTNLGWLNCNNNQLEILDLSGCTNLFRLSLGNNKLSSIDVSSLAKLTVFGCSNNPITYLDVSKNPMLVSLRCYGCPLSKVVLSAPLAYLVQYSTPWVYKWEDTVCTAYGYESNFYIDEVELGYAFLAYDKTTKLSLIELPTFSSAKPSSPTTVDIKWTAPADASFVEVWRTTKANAEQKDYVCIGIYNAKDGASVSKLLTPNKTYYYKLRTYIKYSDGKKIYSGYSRVLSAKPTISVSAPTGLRVTARTNNTISLAWNKVSGSNINYEVWRMDVKGKTPGVCLGRYSDPNSVSKKLTSGKTYYYRVRAYFYYTGTDKQVHRIYSGYSDIVAGKTK